MFIPLILALPIQLLLIILAYGWPLLIGAVLILFSLQIFRNDKLSSCLTCAFSFILIALSLAVVFCIYYFLFPHLYTFDQLWFINHLYYRGMKIF